MPFINKYEFLRDLTIFMISLIWSFDIISVVVPESERPRILDPKIFFDEFLHLLLIFPLLILMVSSHIWSMVWVHSLSMANQPALLIQEVYQRILLAILDRWIFDVFIFTNELFAKSLWIRETCLSFDSKWCKKK